MEIKRNWWCLQEKQILRNTLRTQNSSLHSATRALVIGGHLKRFYDSIVVHDATVLPLFVRLGVYVMFKFSSLNIFLDPFSIRLIF